MAYKPLLSPKSESLTLPQGSVPLVTTQTSGLLTVPEMGLGFSCLEAFVYAQLHLEWKVLPSHFQD